MEISAETYRVWYDEAAHIIFFEGSLRLSGTNEYSPILNLINDAVALKSKEVNWDLQKLDFLNSSGINALYKFVIGVRKKGDVEMAVKGNSNVVWQKKSLTNMQKFMPKLKLEFA